MKNRKQILTKNVSQMEKIERYNGNGNVYSTSLPKIVILTRINETAIEHIFKNTGLKFEKKFMSIEAQPTNSNQIVTLFLTYNFKTQYQNNATNKNTLYLKGDRHVGFKIDSICKKCADHNNVYTKGLEDTDRLSC